MNQFSSFSQLRPNKSSSILDEMYFYQEEQIIDIESSYLEIEVNFML